MTFSGQLNRIERLDRLIYLHSTGTPSELARKLNISCSQLYHIIRIMKYDLGAPIYYSKADQSYCYRENVRFVCAFKSYNILTDKNKI
jgi:hypothetical protein